MDEFFNYLVDNWDLPEDHPQRQSAPRLAAYALWRLNWIHPFEDGNGRTAQAFCYLVLCLKYGVWLPGRRNVMHQIAQEKSERMKGLQRADVVYQETSMIDVSYLEQFLRHLIANQLQRDTVRRSKRTPKRKSPRQAVGAF
jgi:Fic family protein